MFATELAKIPTNTHNQLLQVPSVEYDFESHIRKDFSSHSNYMYLQILEKLKFHLPRKRRKKIS